MNLKKDFLKKVAGIGLGAILLVGSTMAHAQSDNPGPRFGLKGGANFSQLYVNQPNVQDENMKVGYHFGIFGKVPITSFLALQPELLYTNVGSKITYGGSNLANLLGIKEGEVRYNLNYLQVPIGFAVNIGSFNIHAGPYVSYLIGANIKDLEASSLNSTEIADLDTDDFNRVDYGLMGGIGVDIRPVTIGARYNYGFREIGESGIAGRLTSNSKNAVVQLYIGFGF
ncbi:hypothetical protein BH24BAC1_BH24BAC1_21500 [soil metagenome]|jgi:hypothetical protein